MLDAIALKPFCGGLRSFLQSQVTLKELCGQNDLVPNHREKAGAER